MQRNDNNKENNGQAWIDVPSFVNKGTDINQVSGKLKNKINDFDNSNDFVREVNSSLAKQVSYDLDHAAPRKNTNNTRNRKKKKKSSALKKTFYTLLTLTVICCLLMFTPAGKKLILDIAGSYIYGNLDHQESKNTPPTFQDDIVNILLIGVEEIGGAQNTDTMMIATMNTKNHTLKLTSLMRDIYVDIPGYDKNKLNSTFAKGGIDLLYETIQNNFGVKLDGYCMVNFKAFEQIVNYVGGVKVTLTQEEADYLNSTNYISNWRYRTVKAGTQTLNGNQALGYCRVRKRPTATQRDDFGRTQRQRIVLKAIYNKVKKKNIVEQVMLMNKILKKVKITTDIKESAFNRYLEEAVNLKVKNLQTLRIPTDNSYDNIRVPMGRYNVEVLQLKDWDATRKMIHDFIYGTASTASTVSTAPADQTESTTTSQTELDDQTATGNIESDDSSN